MAPDDVDSEKRRAILKGAAATLGVSALGLAAGHPGSGDHGPEGGHEHHQVDEYQMSTVGYHSLGGIGSESLSGDPDEPHFGGISELRIHGDIAAVGILSSHSPTTDRGIAILDVSGYTRAESREELDNAEMSVLSFVPNENQGVSVMDLKFSDDGQYLFATKQPVALLFETTNTETDPGTDSTSENADVGAVNAIDVSDPGNPETVGRAEFDFGIHNCYHHRIGGEDYVFCVKGPVGGPAAVYVLRFDRSSGHLQYVNYWTHDTELTQGEVAEPTDETIANGNEFYAHDIAVIDDPITGDPYAYLANWGTEHDAGNSESGARVLDVSDPTDIEELGVFTMERAHTIEPVRRTVEGKRLFVVGQENPGPDADTESDGDQNADISGEGGHTGHYYLVDATDPANMGAASLDGEQSGDGNELAKWVWRLDVEYDNYTYSAHNIDVVDTEFDGERRLFVSAGHYHAGTRMLELEYPGGPSDTDAGKETSDTHDDGHNAPFSEGGAGDGGQATGRDGWALREVGWSRTHFNVPEEAKFGSLSAATPYHWCTVEENGVLFASCISTGVYAMTLDDPATPVGTRSVHEADVSLSDDGSAFTAGQTNQVTIDVETEAPVEVRLNVPTQWSVQGGDPHEVREVADNRIVEFTEPTDDAGTYNVFLEVQAPPTGSVDSFGPVEITPDVGVPNDQQVWEALPSTEDSNVVIGQSQNV